MKPVLSMLFLWISLLMLLPESGAQKTRDKKKAKDEEVEKPPPPQEEMPGVEMKIGAMDTAIGPGVTRGYSKADFFFLGPDTTAAPADELTAEIKILLERTGSLDIGIQFARLMTSDNEEERKGLPKEFYKRMFEELSAGESRKIFENEIIKIYRKYYTLADVKALLAFYTSETGKKMLKILPQLLEESQAKGGEFGKLLGMKIYNDLLKEGVIK